MGWAGHGDRCLGLNGTSDRQLRDELERTARRRAHDLPRAAHFLLFGEDGNVDLRRVG